MELAINILSFVVMVFFTSSIKGESYMLVKPNKYANFCPVNRSYTYNLSCHECADYVKMECPEGETKVTTGQGNEDCSFVLSLLDLTLEIPGCRHVCYRSVFDAACCPGYWGVDCRECPGGADDPCGGRGTCADGIEGNGTCQCQDRVKGFSCELCEKPDAYGPNCEHTCNCQHGDCIGVGINGTGACDCHSGYEGEQCDQEIISCETITCHDDAKCVEEEAGPKCQCRHGYTGNGTYCKEINACETDPPCHENATCIDKGLGNYECECIENFLGDGFSCQPIDPCQFNFGDCNTLTEDCVYLAPNKSECVCYDGFIKDPETGDCILEDLCPSRGQECDTNANCSTIGPGEISCHCIEGYVGDGKICYGNILERIYDLHTSHKKLIGEFTYAIRLLEFAYKEEFTNEGPFTLFVTTDGGFNLALKNHMFNDLFLKKQLARQVLRQHMIARPLSAEELQNQTFYTLQGSSARLFYQDDILLYNLNGDSSKAVVLIHDIVASNGLIHVIDQVMDKRPQISSSSLRTIGTQMNSNFRYYKVRDLISKLEDPDVDALVQELKNPQSGPWTVFVPMGSAFDDLLPGTMEHLMEEDRKKLYMIIKNHVVKDNGLYATDLVSVRKFTSIGNTATTVQITNEGRILLNNNVSILQTDIVNTNGIIHYIDGFLVPSIIDSVLPRFCNEVTVKQVLGPCGPCHGKLHCQANSDIPLDDKSYGCRYWVDQPLPDIGFHLMNANWNRRHRDPFHDFVLQLDSNYLQGCNRYCNRTKTVRKCCPGFYGDECYPCPGTHMNPCFGRGQCQDGLTGNGTCFCDDEYTGAECEFCKDPNMYGAFCNQTCQCLHGTCDNRVSNPKYSSRMGKCKRCDNGFVGTLCDKQKEYCSLRNGLRCHVHAECIKKRGGRHDKYDVDYFSDLYMPRRMRRPRYRDRGYCKCKDGYRGYNGQNCEEINPCEEGTVLCHVQATCTKTGPGLAECKCDKGWVGDGYYCYPSTECKTKEVCDVNAECVNVGPGQNHCQCRKTYHGNGTTCLPIDMCANNDAGCDPYATCNVTGPGKATCTCKPGLAGDGFTCYGDIPFQLHNSPDLAQMKRLMALIPVQQRFLSDMRMNFTLFAVNNTALEDYLSLEDSAWTTNDRNLLTLFKYHTLPLALTIEDLKQLKGDSLPSFADGFFLNVSTTPQGEVFINDAKIQSEEMFALNGLIYIVSQVLEPYPPPEALSTLEEVLNLEPEFSLFTYLLKRQDFFGTSMYSNKTRANTVPLLPFGEFTVFVPRNLLWTGVNDKMIIQRRYLSYHIVQGRLSKADLFEMGNTSLQTWVDEGTTKTIKVSSVENQLYLDDLAVTLSPSDLQFDWGYVHGIDVMLNPQLNFCEGGCCDGYYGDTCAECPGGAEYYCNNKGDCSTSGKCTCNSGYDGTACQICAANVNCGQVDQCAMYNGECHPFADCKMTRSGVTCKCTNGFIGNGYICKSPCEIENGKCHMNATCELQNEVVICKCKPEFEGDGHQCDIKLGLCDRENGGCSNRANCSVLTGKDGKETVSCTCKADYVGDGYTCDANLWQTLHEMTEEQPFMKQFLQHFRNPEHFKLKRHLQDDKKGKFTVFTPMLGNLSNADVSSYVCSSVIQLDNKLKDGLETQSVNNKVIRVEVNYNDSETDELEFKVNGVRVILKDIPATNGLIHVLETTYDAQPAKVIKAPQDPTLNSAKQRHLSIVYAVLGLLATVAVVVTVVLVVKKKWLDIVMLFDRVRDSRAFNFNKLDEESNESPIAFHSAVFENSTEDTLEGIPSKE